MSGLTVGGLRRALAVFNEDDEVIFGGDGLTFYRLKKRSDDSVTIEFNESPAELSPAFKRKHPAVFVAYARFESDGSVVQEVSVPRL